MVREARGGVYAPLHPVLYLQPRQVRHLRVAEEFGVERRERRAHARAVGVDPAVRVATTVHQRAVGVPGPVVAEEISDLLRRGAVFLPAATLIQSQHGVAGETRVHRLHRGAVVDPSVEELAHGVVPPRLDEAQGQHPVGPAETEAVFFDGMAVRILKKHPLRLVRHGGDHFFVDNHIHSQSSRVAS